MAVRPARHAVGYVASAAGDAADGDGDRHFTDAAERLLYGLENVSRGGAVVSGAAADALSVENAGRHRGGKRGGDAEKEPGVAKVNYLSRDEALGEFRNWSGFGGALDMLEQNPLPAVAIITPDLNFQNEKTLQTLRDSVQHVDGVDEVRMDDSWFARLAALTGLVGQIATMTAF